MSSIYLYLKNEAVPKVPGYKVINRHEKDGQEWEEYKIPGINLFFDKGRFNTNLHHIEEPIPPVVKDIVEDISLYDWIPSDPKRVSGRYNYKSAMAFLEKEKDHYELRILGKLLEDIRELYFQIRSGCIKPFESWEEEQKVSLRQKFHIKK